MVDSSDASEDAAFVRAKKIDGLLGFCEATRCAGQTCFSILVKIILSLAVM